VIPASVTKIGEFCFEYCNPLGVEFAAKSPLTVVRRGTFFGSALTAISLPSAVATVEESAFSDCALLTRVSLPDTLSVIESHAFENSRLLAIELPLSLNKMCGSAIPALATVSVAETMDFFSNHNGLLIAEPPRLLVRCLTAINSVLVPMRMNVLGPWSFAGQRDLAAVVFFTNCSLIRIEAFAFSGSSIRHISIPRAVRVICESSFCDCDSLAVLTFENSSSLRAIERRAFRGTRSLRSVALPPVLATVHRAAFPRDCAIHLEDGPAGAWQQRSGVQAGARGGSARRERLQDWRADVRHLPHLNVVELRGIDSDAAFTEAFERLIVIDHPCIAPFFGCVFPSDAADGVPVVATVSQGGMTLRALLDHTNPPEWWTVTARAITLVGIVAAMAAAHSAGFVHGRLRPSCIHILDDGARVCVSGIGGADHDLDDEHRNYASPDVMRGAVCGMEGDVFAFGVMSVEVTAGSARRPWLNLIERCCVEAPDRRPTFPEIWTQLKTREWTFIKTAILSHVRAFARFAEDRDEEN
jgi:hypothetical protein